jgi:hypothetical protein
MHYLLELNVWIGLLIVVTVVTLAGLIVVIQVKKRIKHKLTKQHEKVGRILFRVTAGLIALLISLSYANERMKQYKIMDSMETEASFILNAVVKLKMLPSEESYQIRDNFKQYINKTISDRWKNTKADPFYSKTTELIFEINTLAYNLPVKNNNEAKIKIDLIDDINEITKLMQVRIYSRHTTTLYLIYILSIGLVFLWVFFTVYNLDLISLSFLSLYNIFVAILIYLVFMLNNPLVGPLKVDAHAFTILKTKGFDNKLK